MNENAIQWQQGLDDAGNPWVRADGRIADPDAWLRWTWDVARSSGCAWTEEEWLALVADDAPWNARRSAPAGVEARANWDDTAGLAVELRLPRELASWSADERKRAWAWIASRLRAGLLSDTPRA